MRDQTLRVSWYRLRATLAGRWGGYLGVVVLIGLTGGIAMGSVAAARRTQSSYPTFLASTNPSDLTVSAGTVTGAPVAPLQEKIARLPGVRTVRTVVSPTFIPLRPDGTPQLAVLSTTFGFGSLDGEEIQQDRPAVVQGRAVDPARADEVEMTATAARTIGVHLGQVVPVGFFSPSQESQPGFGTPAVKPLFRVQARLVGIIVSNNSVVQDDIDAGYGFAVLTPALVRRAVAVDPSSGDPVSYAIQLDQGSRGVTAIEPKIVALLPPGSDSVMHVTARVVTEVELAVKPESVALGAFGGIAALVCLVLGIQAVSRQLRAGDADRQVLRALGAPPAATVGDGLIGVLGAVILGSLLAAAVAAGLSPLSPLGPVRPVYPRRGVALDWTVLGLGIVVLVAVFGGAALVQSYRLAPHRAISGTSPGIRGSVVARAAEAVGLPLAGVIGLRFALEPGRGRTAVPVRSALVGTVVAVALIVSTLTFATSLRTLVSHPALYGWDWTYALNPSTNIPPSATRLLDHDPDVAAWSGVDYQDVTIDGQNVPAIMDRTLNPAVSPPILSGRNLRSDREIVLGAATLAVLHKHVGDTVLVGYQSPQAAPLYIPPTPLRVVGTATFPAIGYSSLVADHTSMGTGALFSEGFFPVSFQRAIQGSDPTSDGPSLAFVRMKAGISAAVGRADMQRIARAADATFAADPNTPGQVVDVLGVQRPAQIVNYRSIGLTPITLAVGLAAGAVAALALSLASSVRRRRRDLALMKAVGFTTGQLKAAVSSQATVAAVLGVAVGVPVGIVVGDRLWTVFARSLDAVPAATVPVLSVALVVVGALVFANLVAALPGRNAARTPTATLLTSE